VWFHFVALSWLSEGMPVLVHRSARRRRPKWPRRLAHGGPRKMALWKEEATHQLNPWPGLSKMTHGGPRTIVQREEERDHAREIKIAPRRLAVTLGQERVGILEIME